MSNSAIFYRIAFIQWVFILIFIPHLLSADGKFTIAIDIGHTKTNFGAVSSRGVSEYTFNYAIANVLLKKIIANKHINAFIINLDGEKISLKKRTQIASEKGADLFISLHHDSVQEKYIGYWKYKQKKNHYSDKFSGYSIFISNKNRQTEDSYRFATFLGEELRGYGFTPTLHHAEKIKGENKKLLDSKKGIYEFDDLVVLKTAKMPAILLECGVIVNRKEELLVESDGFKEDISNAIVNAVLKYSR